jgi:hypothetical protein
MFPSICSGIVGAITRRGGWRENHKVLPWDQYQERVRVELHSTITRGVLATASDYLCDCGEIVYIHGANTNDAAGAADGKGGSLGEWVILDPTWLSKNVFGRLLAPGWLGDGAGVVMPVQTTSRVAAIVDCTDALVGVDVIQTSEQGSIERDYEEEMEDVVMQLLLHFDLCYPMHRRRKEDVQKFLIPALLNNNNPTAWDDLPSAAVPSRVESGHGDGNGEGGGEGGECEWNVYSGRRFVCKGAHDIIPPGFWPRLQVRLHRLTATAVVELDDGSRPERKAQKKQAEAEAEVEAETWDSDGAQLGVVNVWRSGVLINARVQPSAHASGHNVSSDGGLHDGHNATDSTTSQARVAQARVEYECDERPNRACGKGSIAWVVRGATRAHVRTLLRAIGHEIENLQVQCYAGLKMSEHALATKGALHDHRKPLKEHDGVELLKVRELLAQVRAEGQQQPSATIEVGGELESCADLLCL